MKKYFRYFWSLLRHKWFVGIECLREGLFWRGIIHDWSKFLPDEFIPYANFFYGDKKVWKDRFDLAWNRHQKRHDHHWQFWLLTNDFPEEGWRLRPSETRDYWEFYNPIMKQHLLVRGPTTAPLPYIELDDLSKTLLNTPIPLPMSDKARREMLCDWKGANRAYNSKQTLLEWYKKRRHLMQARLHVNTWMWVENALGLYDKN